LAERAIMAPNEEKAPLPPASTNTPSTNQLSNLTIAAR
jgi:hypothetical protein